VFGQGPVCLPATQLAAALGAGVIALEKRRARAKEFGADVLINPKTVENVVSAIRDVTRGLGAHATLEVSSSPAARREAVQSVRTWGRACFVGDSPDILRRQVTIIGSWTFSTAGQADCATFIADQEIDMDALFSDRWKLEQVDEADRRFDRQTDGKGFFCSERASVDR
jgi:threonine dehydrogenase-like Zn-dependent dehydrogenase